MHQRSPAAITVHGREPCPTAGEDSGSRPKDRMNTLSHCVYVLTSLSDGKFYIGYTADLSRRLKEHEDGRSQSTASRRPLRLVYCECFLSKNDALRREAYFKTAKGKRVLRLMLRDGLGLLPKT